MTTNAHSKRPGLSAAASETRTRGKPMVIIVFAIVLAAIGITVAIVFVNQDARIATPPVPQVDFSDVPSMVAELIRDKQKIVEQFPDDPVAWGTLGGSFLAHDLDQPAAICFEHANAISDDDIRWAYLLAACRERIGAPIDEIIDAYDIVIARRPEYTPAHVNLAQSLSRAGRTDDAIASLNTAAAQQPDWAITHRALGQAHVQKGDASEAIRHLREAERLWPGDRGTLAALAQAHQLANDTEKAREYSERSRTADDLIGMEDPIRHFVDEMAVNTTTLDARAREMMAAGDLAGAIRNLRAVTETIPDNASVYARLGEAHARLNQRDEAVAAWNESIKLNPAQPSIYRNLAMFSDSENRHAEARRILEAGYQYAADDEAYVAQLASACEKTGNPNDAVLVLSDFVARVPQNEDVRLRLGDLLLKQDRVPEAITHFNDVLALNSSNANAYFGLGLAFEKQQNVGRAVDAYQSAVRINPQHRARVRLADLGH